MQLCHTLRILPSHCHFPWAVSTAAGSSVGAAAASVVGPYAGSPSLPPGKSIRSCSKRDTDPRTDTPCDLMGILVTLSAFCTLQGTEPLHAASLQSIWVCWKKGAQDRKSQWEKVAPRTDGRAGRREGDWGGRGGCCNWKLSEKNSEYSWRDFWGGILPFSSRLSMSSRAERRGVEERSRQRNARAPVNCNSFLEGQLLCYSWNLYMLGKLREE